MSSSKESIGPIAVILFPRQNESLITRARAVHDAMENNPRFPNPSPTMAVFAADIAALEDAQAKAAHRGKGAAKLRNAARKKVKDDLHHLRDYVQSIVETETNPVDAAAIIESAFMSVKKSGRRGKPPLSAANTDLPGVVALAAKAVGRHATYYWEYSLDQQVWTSAPDTMKASTTISGLISARTYYFRFRALTPNGAVGYSQVVSLLVH